MNIKQKVLYTDIVKDILDNKEFNELKSIEHHGSTTRFEHSVRVSYYSYRLAKMFKLDYTASARAGLLHDFFTDRYDDKNKTALLYDHPYRAIAEASKYYKLNDKEIDMIKCHMFPINPTVPKYAESWIVTCMDKVAAVQEYAVKFRYKIAYLTNLYFIFILNFMK